jgi:hypothetical protein
MRWSDIEFYPPARKLRQFAVLWILFFGGLGAIEGLARGRVALGLCLGLAAAVVGGAGLAAPRLIQPIYAGWMALAWPVGWVVSHVVLGLLYYGLFTPLAVLFRVIGRDTLKRRRKPTVSTYYVPKRTPSDPATYFRQY